MSWNKLKSGETDKNNHPNADMFLWVGCCPLRSARLRTLLKWVSFMCGLQNSNTQKKQGIHLKMQPVELFVEGSNIPDLWPGRLF